MASTHYPLTGAGLVENLFYYLWRKDELNNGPSINIPDTVVYKFRQPAFWFFTAKDGRVKRKLKHNLTAAKIEEHFLRHSFGCDVIACFISADERAATVEYLDRDAFREFLYSRDRTASGILQRFTEPKGTRNTMIRALWSPKVCLLERRVNKHRLHDARVPMYERVVTYEGTELNSVTTPVRGALLPEEVQRVSESIVQHVAEVSFQKYKINRMVRAGAHARTHAHAHTHARTRSSTSSWTPPTGCGSCGAAACACTRRARRWASRTRRRSGSRRCWRPRPQTTGRATRCPRWRWNPRFESPRTSCWRRRWATTTSSAGRARRRCRPWRGAAGRRRGGVRKRPSTAS